MIVMHVPVRTVAAIRQYLGTMPHDDVHEFIEALHGLPIVDTEIPPTPDEPLDVKPPAPDASTRRRAPKR